VDLDLAEYQRHQTGPKGRWAEEWRSKERKNARDPRPFIHSFDSGGDESAAGIALIPRPEATS